MTTLSDLPDLRGAITALPTPFSNGALDEAALERLVSRQAEAGAHGVVACGTTGEAPTLTDAERARVVEICVRAAAGRMPVLAGVGTNATATTLAHLESAAKLGADAALIVAPYYNKPSQDGLYAHFKTLNDAAALPIVIYNIPGRTAVTVSVETMARLSQLEFIVGVKDSTGDLARAARDRLACDADFILLSGEDMTAVGYNAMGGRGCISVASNIVPEICASMQNAMLAGDFAVALEEQDRLAPLIEALFSDTNPAPLKYALSRMGLCANELRLPLAPASPYARQAIDAALERLDLIG
ncbi:MAG: 4-hydroxy-tetrahydrodipicolinate synthase [Parvularculaceae bacterium]